MWKNLLGQAVLFTLLFNLISFVRESSLLSFGEQAPNFELTSVDGEVISTADLTGKPTLLYFWAPWCGVCKASMPNLESYYQENKEQVNVVSVALSFEQLEEVHMALLKHKLTFPTLIGNADVAEQYKIEGFPTYYLLDKNGEVASKSLGYSTELGMNLRTLLL